MTNLMIPRYKVVADYPRCPWKVGRILTPHGNEWDCIDAPTSEKIRLPTIYPHLFKKLEWWEERSTEEMPIYVKDNRIGSIVIKVHKWGEGGLYIVSDANKENGYHSDIRIFLPATEQEYNDYINSK